MEKKGRAELFTGHNRHLSGKRLQLHRPEGIGGPPRGPASRLVLALVLATAVLAVGCGKTIAAPAVPAPEVEVASRKKHWIKKSLRPTGLELKRP